MTKETIEAMLTRIALEFDKDYFNGIGLVIGVKFARFYWDWRCLKMGMMSATFGLYDSSTRVVYLNAFFHKPLNNGLFLREVKAIIFHELCHGVLINSLQPLRLNMYDRSDDHGPEFQALERRYPEHITQEKLSGLIPSILSWMRYNTPKQVREE